MFGIPAGGSGGPVKKKKKGRLLYMKSILNQISLCICRIFDILKNVNF